MFLRWLLLSLPRVPMLRARRSEQSPRKFIELSCTRIKKPCVTLMRLLKSSWDSALESLRIVIFVDKRKPFEFDLIDILHDVGRNRSEYWIFLREIGIKVVDITFRFLRMNRFMNVSDATVGSSRKNPSRIHCYDTENCTVPLYSYVTFQVRKK